MILEGIQACLFDNDGVLVDSKEAVVKAWNKWGDEVKPGFRYSSKLHGRRAHDIVKEIVTQDEFAAAAKLIDIYELENADQTIALPGAIELTSSIPVGKWNVCTSAYAELGKARLAAAGISYPETIVTADDVSKGKPDGEPYELGAKRLGVDPKNCLVLEDALPGIQAGWASGAGLVIGVGEEILEFTEKEIVISDLRGISYVDGQFQLNEEYRLR